MWIFLGDTIRNKSILTGRGLTHPRTSPFPIVGIGITILSYRLAFVCGNARSRLCGTSSRGCRWRRCRPLHFIEMKPTNLQFGVRFYSDVFFAIHSLRVRMPIKCTKIPRLRMTKKNTHDAAHTQNDHQSSTATENGRITRG